MEQLIEKLNKAPIGVKAGAMVGLVVLLTVGTYFLFIQEAEERIEQTNNQQAALDKQLAEKKEIADNLNERKLEMDQLEQKLQEALTELPEEKDIDGLLAQLNDIGKKSGLEIGKVVPGPERPETFFSRIPISMSVSGNYHEIAMFMQEIANMRRIVNVNNITLKKGADRGEKMILEADFLATTFRFYEPSSADKANKAGGM